MMNKYEKAYDMIRDLQIELQPQVLDQTFYEPDYQIVKALAATYLLQDYLANKIAEIGETPEGEEFGEDIEEEE